MSKPRHQNSGLSKTPKSQASRKKPAQSSTDHSAKEQQAVALINQGKLQEAEVIYRELIAAGTSSHIVYGNLAAICLMQQAARAFRSSTKPCNSSLTTDAHHNLGNALKERGDLPQQSPLTTPLSAQAQLPRRSLQPGQCPQSRVIQPQQSPPTTPLLTQAQPPRSSLQPGHCSPGTRRPARAIIALRLKPNHPDTHNNLGNALKEQSTNCSNRLLQHHSSTQARLPRSS